MVKESNSVNISFGSLLNSVTKDAAKTLIVAAAHDKHTLEAVFYAAGQFPMRYFLVGDRDRILSISRELGCAVDRDAIVDGGDDADCARKSVSLIREGRGDVLMKGILETGTLLKAVLDKDSGIRASGVMSHLAMVEVPRYHKAIFVTDGGILTYPTAAQKADIVRNAVSFCNRLGLKRPYVAALCASESVSDKMPETSDAALLQEMCKRGELGDCLLEGPVSFDIAIDPESAKVKGYKGEISGEADILLLPNIAVGNILVKGLIYWGGAKMAGCVLGAGAPIVLVSRGASAEEKFLSIALCMSGG